MDFRQLESFISITKNKSFSKAAKELYLTQPTISNHIQNLEKELKTTLINRDNKQIELTKAGEIFYRYAEDILVLKDKAQFDLGEYTGKVEGTVQIYASTIPEQYILPRLLKNFNHLFPEIKFRINHLDSYEILTAITENKIDYGFVGVHVKNSNLEYIPIMDDELLLITPPSFEHPEGTVSLETFQKIPLILREEGSGTRDLLSVELKKNKIDLNKLNICIYSENASTIKHFVEEGFGCAVMSKIAVEKELRYQSLKSYTIAGLNLQRKFYLVVSKSGMLAPLENNFIHYIRTHCRI